ncbi:MAG TPA: hypothetical protein VE549_16625 [Myxococcaceae bacterium]|nr:hypothetical protein [Myxococcaceae bacterium]
MSRLIAFAIALLPAVASAYGPVFSRSGLYFNLQYGPGFYKFSQPHLAAQLEDPNDATIFVDEMMGQWNHTGSARLGLNIAGFASVEAVLTGAGWNVTSVDRGGGGYLGGVLGLHPLQLFFQDNRVVDISAFGGAGYGIVGKTRGADGRFLTWGGTVDYYFSPSVFLGAFYRYIRPQFENFYINYDLRSQPGMTVPLPNGSGGSFWTAGLTMGFRMEL